MDKNEKKAVVIGGSNGIGLAIAMVLQKKAYHVIIVDRCKPENKYLNNDYTYIFSDLLDFQSDLFKEFADDNSIEFLMLTAGIGRVADFEYLHPVEIEKILNLNTNAVIKIIRLFYERIKNEKNFYCGVMGSIAGLVSSPMFSVYAASKAAVCRFVESVNIELEAAGVTNRILNIAPGSIKGTCFNGGKNELILIKGLAEEIITRMLAAEVLYIPEYDTVYKGVLERYQKNPHEFGLSSYQYKKASKRVQNEKKVCIGYLSGTFDLFHVGHLNLLKRAKKECDYLIVGVHKDASHKGKETFIPFEERVQILEGCKYVNKVVTSCREDSDAWKLWKYNKLFVGSDYRGSERFKRYENYFQEKAVEIVYFPYTKNTSSTQIRNVISKKIVE